MGSRQNGNRQSENEQTKIMSRVSRCSDDDDVTVLVSSTQPVVEVPQT